MRIESPKVFEEYNCYKCISRKENRVIVSMVSRKTGKHKTISYARFLMCIKENRILETHEEVDHIDNDKRNDNITNLQILTRDKNLKKYHNTLERDFVELICPFCEKEFTRERRQTHLNGRSERDKTFCSKDCSDEFRKQQPKTIKHGTFYTYCVHKCRCILCKEARRLQAIKYNNKKKI